MPRPRSITNVGITTFDAQRFLSAFSGISPHFRPGRHRLSAVEYRREMTDRFTTWNQITGTATAA